MGRITLGRARYSSILLKKVQASLTNFIKMCHFNSPKNWNLSYLKNTFLYFRTNSQFLKTLSIEKFYPSVGNDNDSWRISFCCRQNETEIIGS